MNHMSTPPNTYGAKWKLLSQNGVDTTALLANGINHPSREMAWMFAYSLLETMMR